MEGGRAIFISLVTCGVLALVLQLVAIFTPGWVIIEGGYHGTSFTVGFNPYYVSAEACESATYGYKVCDSKDISIDDLENYGYSESHSAYVLVDDLWPAKFFGTFGLIGIIISFIVTFVWSKNNCRDKGSGVVSILGWFVSITLLGLAIGLHMRKMSSVYGSEGKREMESMQSILTIKALFPYSVLLCGSSMFFGFVVFIMSLVRICTVQNAIPGAYNQFTNPMQTMAPVTNPYNNPVIISTSYPVPTANVGYPVIVQGQQMPAAQQKNAEIPKQRPAEPFSL